MNFLTFILFLFLNRNSDSLIGIWLYKEDTSRIEVFTKDEKFFGVVLSSNNPDCEAGTEILKDFQLVNGKWQGKYFLIKKNQWMDATVQQLNGILHFEINYGFIVKKFHWYREK